MTPMAAVRWRTADGVELEVRRLASGDEPALRAFHQDLGEVTRARFLPHATDAATLRRLIGRNAAGRDLSYLLWHGTEVVGYFFLWEFDRPVPVLGLGLADAWQRRGLGGRMIDRLISDARAAGRDAVELTTVPENEPAQRLYLRRGFRFIGEVENIAGDGRAVREWRMFLSLGGTTGPAPRAFGPPA